MSRIRPGRSSGEPAPDGLAFPAPHPAARLAHLPLNIWLVGQEGLPTQRSGRYSLASVRGHPGKMLPALARCLVEEYTCPGDLVLDPMSGIGTVGVEAVRLGRRYVGVELEAPFVAWQQENLAAARKGGASGAFVVRQGDARELAHLFSQEPSLACPVDAVLTSPPYANRLGHRNGRPSALLRDLADSKPPHAAFGAGYGTGPGNIGNLAPTAYLREMEKVYAGCLAILKPGGLLAVVIRPVRVRGRLVPLHHQTTQLCRELGFEFLDEVVACLARVDTGTGPEPRLRAHALFLRRLAVARQRAAGLPVSLEQTEFVLLFRKPVPPEGKPGSEIPSGGRQRVRDKGGRLAALAGRDARAPVAG